MRLQARFLVVLTATCAISGNGDRLKEFLFYFDSPPALDHIVDAQDVPTTRHNSLAKLSLARAMTVVVTYELFVLNRISLFERLRMSI